MDVKLPDGRILKNVPEGTTKAQIAAKLGISETGQTRESVGLSPAQEFQNEHPLIRTLGRGGRAVAGGLSSIADLPLLALKTTALGTGLAAENMGAPEIGRGLQRVGQIPSLADTTRSLIDQATGGRLKPTGTIDKIGDFAGEMISAAIPISRADDVVNLTKAPGIKDAVKGVLSPESAIKSKSDITTDVITKSAKNYYSSARETGAAFSDDIAKELSKTVDEQRILDPFAKGVLGDDEIDKIAEGLKEAAKHKMSLESFEALDKRLGAMGNKAFKAGDDDLVRRYDNIQDRLRELVTDQKFIEGSAQGVDDYRKATSLWALRAKSRDIDKILENAQTYVGGEAAGIKAGAARLMKSKGFARYLPEEKEIIKRAAKTGKLSDLSALGSRLLTIGGAVKGGPAGAIAGHAASEGVRSASAAVKKSQMQKLADLLADQAIKIDPSLAPSPAIPLLTDRGSMALLGATNAAGQKLLPKPMPSDPVALGRLLAQ